MPDCPATSQEGSHPEESHSDSVIAAAFSTPAIAPGVLRGWYRVYFVCLFMLVLCTVASMFIPDKTLPAIDPDVRTTNTLILIGKLATSTISFVLIIVILIFKTMILHRAAAQVRPAGGAAPELLVWPLFVPLFNATWALIAYFGLSQRQRQMQRENQIEGRQARPWLVLIWSILGILAWLSILGSLFVPVFILGTQDLLNQIVRVLVVVAFLLWPLALHDITASAESIAKWRRAVVRSHPNSQARNHAPSQARSAAHRPPSVAPRSRPARRLPRYLPRHVNTYYGLYLGFSVGAFLFAVSFVFLIFAIPAMIAGSVFKLMFVYKAWNQIQDVRVRTSGGKAVGFLFIPFFNLYWAFVAFVGLTEDINRYMNQRKIPGPRSSPGLAITSYIFMLLTLIPYIGLLFLVIGGPFWLLTLNRVRKSSMAIAAWKLDLTKRPPELTISA